MWSYLTRANTHVAGAEEIEPLRLAYRCGWPQHADVVVLTLLSGAVDVQGLRLAAGVHGRYRLTLRPCMLLNCNSRSPASLTCSAAILNNAFIHHRGERT